MQMLRAIALTLMSGSALAQGIQFTWDVPTEREDGSTLFTNEIAGYTLYENNVAVKWIAGGASYEALYDYDGYGQPCFSISTTDVYQQEGAQSAEVCVNVFPAPPTSPVLNVSL